MDKNKYILSKCYKRRYLSLLNSRDIGYIKALQEQKKIIRIGNVMIDISQIILKRFKCSSLYCVKKIKENSKLIYKKSCCTDLLIEITIDEIKRIKKLLYLFAISSLKIESKINLFVKKLNKQLFYKKNNVYEYYLLSNDNNTCILSYFDNQGKLNCLIDKICLILNLPISYYKPTNCFLWPLYFTEISEFNYFITLIGKENYLTLRLANFIPKCLKKPQNDAPYVYISLKSQLTYILGKKFYSDLYSKASFLINKKIL